jgi:hypothetical protein
LLALNVDDAATAAGEDGHVAHSASPGPFTTQPITVTFTGVLIVASFCCTSATSLIRSISIRPQAGQAISSG